MAKNQTTSPELPTTQRAYTLRLRGAPGKDGQPDNSWRDALWATHEAVNKGAKAFGDWLLTLRGGLAHTLADEKVKAGKNKPDRKPTDEERKNRRILLALSWLSVEDERGAPKQFIIAKGTDSADCRSRKLRDALVNILKSRGVSNANTWLDDCLPSLSAAIREDAVWVNRSAAFDAVTKDWNGDSARNDAKTLLWHILKDDYLSLPVAKKPVRVKETGESEETGEEGENQDEQRQKAVKQSSKGAAQRTRHPFSHLFGEGNPFGKPSRSMACRDCWHAHLKPLIEGAGLPVVLPRKKGQKKEKDTGPAHTELQREMFSKAAARLAQIWTKQRQQEVDRQARQAADGALKEMEDDSNYTAALQALTNYCKQYKIDSGTTGEFRIRPAQITGWERVVGKWADIAETDSEKEQKRIDAVKELQDADLDRKFGDPNLFIRFADQEYSQVWQHEGKPDAEILKRYVAGMKARSDAIRLKVAAYRHPDQYHNPVFCQFGVSRPAIAFRRLKKFTTEPAGEDVRAIGMLLWNPIKKTASITVLHGTSRRFDREIGSACDTAIMGAAALPEVSRKGRLGAAAAGLTDAQTPSKVAGVFDLKPANARGTNGEQDDDSDEAKKEPKWNGTLSTNRRELETIAALLDRAEKAPNHAQRTEAERRATVRRRQLRWTLTIALELKGRGPWYEFVAKAADKSPFHRTARKDEETGKQRKKGTRYISWNGWPFEEINRPLKEKEKALVVNKVASRGFHASFILSRLPGLRVLSLDLGHRYAAACAVWETLTLEQMNAACKAAKHALPAESDLYLHLSSKGADAKERIKIYRRVGPDKLDGKPHPAPWARLDRQFLVKLQGEDRPARAPSNDESRTVANLEKRIGLTSDDDSADRRRVDELMGRAVRTAALGLKRHARRAKIAYALDPATNSAPGMGGKETAFQPGDKTHLTDALFDWQALAGESKWDDKFARDLWNSTVGGMNGAWHIQEPKRDGQTTQEKTRQQRRKDDDATRERLKPIAEQLAKADRADMHRAWKAQWEKDDGPERGKPDFENHIVKDGKGRNRSTTTARRDTSGWHADFRWLTDWIMGWHLDKAQSKLWTRNVGGLSLTRITTMKSLYQLHKAFAMRARPDKPRGAPEKGETNAGVAQSILQAMERMRENRVKQLASRIAEAALGIGSEDRRHWEKGTMRPRQRIDDARFAPCHAVVIENLTNYRPDELQTRRENRQLMSWSSSKVKKYLSEACQLHGLHLREVQPGYTSRQDSRTGAPGVRCNDVPLTEFFTAPWWTKAIKEAKDRKEKSSKDRPDTARHQYLRELDEKWRSHWEKMDETARKAARPLRIPAKGGELFVSADPRSPAAKGLQADLNAAANIGLRALLDPDWPGKWWYIPCNSTDFKPVKDKVAGSTVLGDANIPLISPTENNNSPSGKTKDKKNKRDIVNLWRDASAAPLLPGHWQASKAYWNGVEARVVEILRQQIPGQE